MKLMEKSISKIDRLFCVLFIILAVIAAALEAQTINGSTNTPTSVANSVYSLDNKHNLVIGDRLSFRILEDEEDSKQLVVADSGEMEVPYIGRIAAEGKTCRRLGEEIKMALEKEYYYHATVVLAIDVMVRAVGKVYLVGAVRLPGPQEIPSDEALTVSKAILRSGGFTEFAEEHQVKVTRKDKTSPDGTKTIIVNVGDVLRNGKTGLDVPVEPDDLIYIPDRLIRF
jgi:protein involved in polysaccharide export with SLBB domain